MKLGLQVATALVIGCCAMGAPAQTSGATATGAMVAPSKSFDASLSSFETEMMGLVRAMPADKYDFAPKAEIFTTAQKTEYAGVSSFGKMVKHVAQANFYYAATLSGLKPDVDVKAIANLQSKDEIVSALASSFAFAHKAIATLTPENAFQGVHENDTRASLAGGLVAHGFDHYGQLVEYLRMNGMVPPASRK